MRAKNKKGKHSEISECFPFVYRLKDEIAVLRIWLYDCDAEYEYVA